MMRVPHLIFLVTGLGGICVSSSYAQEPVGGLITEGVNLSAYSMKMSPSQSRLEVLGNLQIADSIERWESEGRSSLRFGVGVQTIRGSINQRWTSLFGYQHKISEKLAVPFEIQLFRSEHTGIKTLFFLSVALKAYLHVIPRWSFFIQAGPQVGGLLFPLSLHYSLGTEISLDQHLALFLTFKRTGLDIAEDFVLSGVVLRLGESKK